MNDHEPNRNPGRPPGAEIEDQEEDFAALLEAGGFHGGAKIQRDSKIRGTIVSIGEEWLFVDIGGKSEGAISREELVDKDGNLTVALGDAIDAYVVSTRPGEILLSVKMTGAASEEAIRGAYASGVPVEGFVESERKGGYSVTVLGKPAFCPYSQIDLGAAGKAEDYVGKRFTFRIIEYSDRGRNIVLSRRELLEEDRAKQVAQLKETLKPGDIVTGTVQKLAQFGAFVDIGGIEGLIPMSELAWWRVNDAADILSPGEPVTVRVLDVDWSNRRISLSRKHTLDDPWNEAHKRYPEERTVGGKVTKLMNFGAFVELEPGVEGLVHISNLGSGRRLNHPKEVLTEGDEVEVKVLSVDSESRRIGLELVTSGQGEDQVPAVELNEGAVVQGVVESVKDYGVFLSLPGGKSGLLHVSEIGEQRKGDLRGRFPVGSSVDVQILSIDSESKKISLSTKRLSKKMEDSHFADFAADKKDRGSLGTLGDLLKDKLKK
ncbi:MAG: 30S ribosomal protein S1 [Desulfomonilaceae bacterium]|nr:30S ribosomal protein S1 [Desulfomonilaceae bacterium]